jgi:ferredoxin
MGTESRVVVSVDLSKCEGHGRCYAVAPDDFAPVDDFGHAGLVSGPDLEFESSHYVLIRRAADGCPERAISLHKEGE